MKKKTSTFLFISAALLLFILLLLYSGAPAMKKNASAVPEEKKEKITSVEVEIVEEKKIEPVKKPEVKPKPEPEEKKTEAPEPKSEPANKVEDTEAENFEGVLPPLYANYREGLGFRNYSKAMVNLGADFFIVGSSRKKLYRIDFRTENLIPVSLDKISSMNFSPRTRVISDEPALNQYLEKARAVGISSPEVLLLVPQAMENKIASGLRSALGSMNNSALVTELDGNYGTDSGRLYLIVRKALLADGRSAALNIKIKF